MPRFLGETSCIYQYGYLDLEHYVDLATVELVKAQQTAFYPYFYVALSIFINSKASDSIKRPKVIYLLAIFISCGMLLKNFVDFGSANLHV